MKHLGDITKIDGHKVPLVDIITGGSPCQDLSVAGKRAGLEGARSGLFMEQIRIIKEMRNESAKQLRLRGANEPLRPRYMVWENVPGAFSSNKGEDFRAVLEETAKIVCEDAVIPRPENGKWSPSGCIMGDGWSIAWRVHDAQFWGVPQRRKRIALVADFGGNTATKILFESESLSRDSETSREEGQGASSTSERSVDPSSYTLKIRGGVEVDSHGKKAGKGPLIQTELSGTLGVSQDQTLITKVVSVDEKMGQTYIGDNLGNTLGARDYKQPQAVCVTQGCDLYNQTMTGEVAATLNATSCDSPSHSGPSVIQTYQQTTGALCARDYKGVGNQYVNEGKLTVHMAENSAVVRRLTPMECERLQGYPDHWTDIGEWTDSKGKLHKDADSPRYKALGNSIALPFWEWMAKRMVKHLDKDHPTMASLFDGIGGFPLVYSRAGCEAIWASEIEEFPIAVTKIRFPDDKPQA